MEGPPTPDSIKRLVLQLLRPKHRDDLRATVARSVAPDAVFAHSLGLFRGRDGYYSALRVATALWRYEGVDFEDVFVSGEQNGVVKAALVLVLTIRPLPFLPLPSLLSPRLDFPTIAVLHFRRRSRGDDRYLLARHVDANSLVALATGALSPLRVPWRLAARFLLPALGACGVLAARALDAGGDALGAARAAAGAWLRPLMLLMD
jgi:hypothetical protein